MLGVGIYVHLKIGDYVDLSSVKYVTGSIIIITVGAVIAIITFFGCCGAMKENRCLLGMVSLQYQGLLAFTTLEPNVKKNVT